MTLEEAYGNSLDFLEKCNIGEAGFKALCAVCSAAEIKNSGYYFNKSKELSKSAENRLEAILFRLRYGEPLQYALGKWEFYDSEFYVGKGVLIPRPETEELVDLCLESVDKNAELVVYDLCSGSGCIGISLAKRMKNSTVYCVEKSEAAFSYLEKNALGVKNAVPVLGDIGDDLNLQKADIIISNPPYIKTSELPFLQNEVKKEPRAALDGGEDGLDFYRIINEKWAKRLKKNGRLFLEIGDTQGKSVKTILKNFKDIKILTDVYKNDRMVTAEKA